MSGSTDAIVPPPPLANEDINVPKEKVEEKVESPIPEASSEIVPPPPLANEDINVPKEKVEEKVESPIPEASSEIVPPPPPSNTGGENLEIGTLIWVKVDGYPWWPAKVVKETLADEEMLKDRIETDTNLVQFFGDNSIFWVNCDDVESCKVYENHMNLMDDFDGEYKEDLKKATTTLKRLHKRKMRKRKRENDLLLKEREKASAAKKRKVDDDNTSPAPVTPNVVKTRMKKKRKRLGRNVKMYDILGDMTEPRLREVFADLKKFFETDSVEDLKKLLVELISHRVTMEQIISTKVGGVVNNLRNHANEEISELSRRIVYSWKSVVKSFVE